MPVQHAGWEENREQGAEGRLEELNLDDSFTSIPILAEGFCCCCFSSSPCLPSSRISKIHSFGTQGCWVSTNQYKTNISMHLIFLLKILFLCFPRGSTQLVRFLCPLLLVASAAGIFSEAEMPSSPMRAPGFQWWTWVLTPAACWCRPWEVSVCFSVSQMNF